MEKSVAIFSARFLPSVLTTHIPCGFLSASPWPKGKAQLNYVSIKKNRSLELFLLLDSYPENNNTVFL
jgi:hypothetical protein